MRWLINLGIKYPRLGEIMYRARNIYWGSPADIFRDIHIETTTICNRKCSYCPYSKFTRGKNFMEESLVYKILNELAEMNYRGKVCLHFYGEPLIDKRLPKFIDEAHKKLPKSKISIYTNGDLLTPEIFKELVKLGVGSFDITQHDKTMSKSMEKIFQFIKENPEYGKYLHYMPKLLKPENRGGLVEIEKIQPRKHCFMPTHAISIIYNGDAVLCCEDFFGKYAYGNAKTEKIKDIWNKPHYKKIRKECGKGIYNLDICKKCVGIK